MIRAVPWSGRDGGDERRPAPRSEPRISAADVPTRLYGSQLNRMESTLNSLLTAVASSAGGTERSNRPRGKVHPSLGAAIAEVSRRQKALDDQERAPSRPEAWVQPQGSEASPETAAWPESRAATTSLMSLQGDIAALAIKLDDMRREQAARHAEPAACNLDKLRTEIGNMSEALCDLASRGSIATLEQAIRGLAQKIEASRTEGIKDTVLQPLEQLVGELRLSLAEIDPRMTIKGLDGELKRLGTKLDDLGRSGIDPATFQNIQSQTQEIRDLLTAAMARPLPVERIERQVAQLVESIDRSRAAGHAPGVYAYDDRASAFDKIEERLDAIAAKVEEAVAEARDESHYEALSRRIDNVQQGLTARIAEVRSGPDTRPLEDLVRSLAQKLERAQEPQAEPQAIEALEQQISELAHRLDASNAGFSSLTSLEQTISHLFAELERTRGSALEAAENAAGPLGSQPSGIGHELQRLRAVQDEADRRTVSTLNAVHETLEKVVDRLAMVEEELTLRPKQPGELLASGQAPVFAPAQQRDSLKGPQIGAGDLAARRDTSRTSGMAPAAALEDFLIEPGSGFPGRREGANRETRQGRASEPEAPTTRSDFIAAARRAAQAAQIESPTAVAQSQARSVAPKDSAGLVGQTRNFIAQHKRPVVLSLAALFVAIGAYAVVKTMGHPQPTNLSSNIDTPVAAMIAPQAASPQIAAPAHMTVAALDPSPAGSSAQQAAPGVDPMATGSIGKPQGAGGDITQSDPQAAAEAGNAKAQFALATNYAEGRHVPRDLSAAAQWYAKAAAQGLAPAQYRLASFYEKGLGVEHDLAPAKAWYQRAAELGNIRAMHNLAVLAADGGDAGSPDYATAAEWFKKAAEYGVRDSQYNLAVLLARGLGVPQNFVSSYTWFAIAAAQGDDDAARKRDDVGARVNASELAAAKAMAAAFRAKTPDPAANDVQPPAGGWSESSPGPAPMSKPQRPKVTMM
jgi:localization factor PodJL